MPTQNFSAPPSNLWRYFAMMGGCLILLFIAILIYTSALTSVAKQFHFEWNYDVNMSGLAGYILYQDDRQLLIINDPNTLTLDYTVEVEPGQTVVFTMKAFDDKGTESVMSAAYSIEIPLEPEANALPTASLNFSTATASNEAPLAVDFSSLGSTDPDGTIVSYAWDFGDGASARTSSTSHTYTIAGTYTVTLTVTDNDGGIGTDKTTITVTEAIAPNSPPTASLILSPATGEIPLAVAFSAENSTDSDGSIVSYAWDFGDGTAANTATAGHTYTIAGIYTVTLTVTDNMGATATAQSTVTCSDSDSLDLISKQLYFEWNYDTNQPGLAGYILYQNDLHLLTIDNPATLTTDHLTQVEAGTTVVFTIKAFDINGKESVISAPFSIDVPLESAANDSPTAILDLSTTSGTAPLAVDFSAVNSTDSDGSISSYAWQFGDGTSANTSTASHTYTIDGTYTVTLTITDNDGATGTAQSTVTVAAPTVNILPTASLILSTSSGEAPLTVEFSAGRSTDSDGTIVAYAWDFDDGTSANTSTASHTYTIAGTYTVTLTVTDNDGGTGTAQNTVTVAAPTVNILPTASLIVSTSSGEAPLTVEFSAERSTDSDGTIVAYAWDFDDGTSANTSTASHTYTIAGTYTVTLTVTDNDGGTASAQSTVTVAAPTVNILPTALFSPTTTSGTAPLEVGFDGTKSSDADGTITSYFWDFGDGSSITGGPQVSHTYTTSGSFTARLTVIDNEGAQASYQAIITVTAPAPSAPPVAAISFTPQSPTNTDFIQFSGARSTPTEDIIRYLWDFGDGKSATGVTATHKYKAGSYTVTLTVWNSSNVSNKISVVITVRSQRK